MKLFLSAVTITLLMIISAPTQAQSFPNPANLSTGQGTPGSLDPIWTVSQWYSTSPPNPMGLTYTPALINNNCAPGSWVNPSTLPPPTNNGNWISGTTTPCAGNTNDGYLYFRLTLNLPTDCNGNSVTVAGNYTLYFSGYVDNQITDIFVNGNSTGINGGGFSAGSQLNITLPGPWIQGTNYVDVQVYNYPNGGNNNPYGLLLVANATASATADGDGDGVVDISDQCPCTTGPAPSGCPPATITGITTICQGGTTTLTATGGGTYLWSDNSTGNTLTVSPTVNNTAYSVVTTQPSGFTSSASVNITVNPLPIPAISPAAVTICNGQSTTLTASGGTGYTWNSPASTAATTVSPTVATTYVVTVTDANNCSAATTRTVNVNQPPTPAITPAASTICNGQSTTLTASGGSSYHWTGNVNTAALTVSPTTTTTYDVTVTDVNTCTATTSRIVNVNQLPIPAITPATATICNGQSTTLTASGGTGYHWTGNVNTAALTVSPATATTYSVTVTDANTCSASTSRTVNVNQLPIPVISPATVTICNGQSTTLTASGGTGYTWTGGVNTAPLTVSPATATTYSVTVTDANTCSASTSRTINVNQLPIAAITPATVTICNGQSTTLTASGGTGYHWAGNINTAALTVSPTITTTYDVTVTDANTCTATTSRLVTVNQLPIPAITPATATICNGQSTTLTASGGTGYHWTGNVNTAALTISPTITTVYDVTVTDANTCTATTSRTVTVNQLPIPSITPATVAICNGQSTTLTASGGTGYLWSNTDATAATTVTPSITTTYSVVVTDANSCSASASRSVTVHQLPVPTITPASSTICAGGTVTLTAGGGTGYTWTGGVSTAVLTVSPTITTTYDVTVTDANTCSASTSRIVNVNQLPTPSISPTTVTICNGQSTTLTASGGTGYHWTGNVNTAALTISPSTTTTYDVTVTDANNCSATTSQIVNVNQLPIPSISPATAAICNGDNVTLTASGGTGYLWSNTDATAATTVSPAVQTTYSVVVTDANNCSASATRTVNVNPLPTPSITPASTAICIGTSTTLTASGGTSYLWSNTDATAATTVSPTVLTTYSVVVTDANNCSATTSSTVSVNPLPTPSITTIPAAICVGGSSTLTASGGTGYLWNTTDQTAAITVSPTTFTTYSVVVTDANNCSASATGSVTVNPLPIAAITPSAAAICTGDNTTLTASGGTSYVWSNSDVTAATTVSPTTLTTYSVVVTDANTCSSSASATVTVNPLPIPAINPSTTSICAGTSTTLTASGGTSYTWSNSDNTASTTVSPTTLTTYSVIVTDANSCSAATTSTVTVNPVPTALITSSAPQVCEGSSATLTASGGISYHWANTSTNPTITVTPIATGTYTVVVTDANTCTATGTFTLPVIPAMTLSTTKTDVSCYGDADGSIDLTVGSGQSPYTYLWNTNATMQDPNGLIAASYSVVVTDHAGCTAATAATIATPTSLILAPAFTDPTCATLADNGTITIGASGGSPAYDYLWSNNATSSSLQNLSPGTYSVAVTDLKGCSATASFTLAYMYDLTVHATPAVTIDLAESTPIAYTVAGNTGTLTAVWSPSYGLSCTDCDGPIAGPNVSTTYHIDIKNDAGCTASDTTSVIVIPNYNIYIPNAFSPNGDGKNDLFEIYGNLKAIKFLEISIFNRWGERVYKSNDINFTWDGTYNGGLLEPGTFVWQLNLAFIDDHSDGIKKGSLTILR